MPTESQRRTAPGGAVLLAAVGAFAVGALGAVQSRANGTLAGAFGSVVDTALWSFGSGWILLTLAMLHPAVRGGLHRARSAFRGGSIRWWQFLGGLIGATFVLVQAWSVPQVGVALFTIAIVGGQTVNALLVDGIGLGPAGKAPVTWGRTLAALGTFVGVAVAMLGRSGGAGGALPPAVVLVAVVTGALMAVQQAVNGRVNRVTGHVLTTTWINFTWGLTLLLVAFGADVVRGSWRPPASYDAPPWAWVGGLIGIVFVGVGAVVVHRLGVLLATLLTLAGQVIGAVLVDLLMGGTGAHVDAMVVIGVVITLISAGASAWAGQRSREVSRSRAGR